MQRATERSGHVAIRTYILRNVNLRIKILSTKSARLRAEVICAVPTLDSLSSVNSCAWAPTSGVAPHAFVREPKVVDTVFLNVTDRVALDGLRNATHDAVRMRSFTASLMRPPLEG